MAEAHRWTLVVVVAILVRVLRRARIEDAGRFLVLPVDLDGGMADAVRSNANRPWSACTAVAIPAIDIFVSLGTPREQAVAAGSLIGLAYLLSRGLDVAVGARVSRMALARLVYAAFPLSLLPLLVCAVADVPLPFWLAALTAFLYGLPAGLLGILRPALPFHVFGSLNYGRRLGGWRGRWTLRTRRRRQASPG